MGSVPVCVCVCGMGELGVAYICVFCGLPIFHPLRFCPWETHSKTNKWAGRQRGTEDWKWQVKWERKHERKKRGDIGGNWREGSKSLWEPPFLNVSITHIKYIWKEKNWSQKRYESLAKALFFCLFNKFGFKAHLYCFTKMAAITSRNLCLIHLRSGHCSLGGRRILAQIWYKYGSLIYTISPSSNPETRGERERDINNSLLLFPPGQPVCFYIKCWIINSVWDWKYGKSPSWCSGAFKNCPVPRVPER